MLSQLTEAQQKQQQREIEKVEEFARRWTTYSKDSHWDDVDEFVKELLEEYLQECTSVNKERKTSAYKTNLIQRLREQLAEANQIVDTLSPLTTPSHTSDFRETRWESFKRWLRS